MNVRSLFSGIGGMDAGLARAGLSHAFFCEIDEWRRGVLAARFPGVPIYDDVRSVAGSGAQRGGTDAIAGRRGADAVAPAELRAVRGRESDASIGATTVSLLCGGFPCQDLSVAGRRAGLIDGERSSLFFEFARIADELVPTNGWILIENVPGLLSSNGGRDFAVVLATLADLGFHDLAWRVLDSRHFGVPQRRRRVFILARRRARGRGAFEVLLEPESGSRDPQAGREARSESAVASLSGLGTGGPDDNDGQAGRIVAATSGSHPGSNMPGRRREDDTNLVAFHATQDPISGPEVPAIGRKSMGNGVSSAAGVRRLTPVEYERLQGLPDGWTDPHGDAPDSRRYAALGDAVTANVAEWIGRRLLDYCEREDV